MKKIKLKAKMWKLVTEAVDEGILYEYNRAHKHVDNPSGETFRKKFRQGIMGSLDGVVEFRDTKDYGKIAKAVQAGIDYGLTRAYEHTHTPGEHELTLAVYNAVTDELSEVVNFD